MFTGIVEEVGTILAAKSASGGALRVDVGASRSFVESLGMGDSVAVSGCCLTVVDKAVHADASFAVELVAETVARTAPRWMAGSEVNLERAMRAGGLFGGHVVTGHVDGVAEVVAVDVGPGAHLVRFAAPGHVSAHLVPKGSVAIDGVSLTVVDVGGPGGSREEWPETHFDVSLIPHTLEVTTAWRLVPGWLVNIETDVLAKHVERIVALREARSVRGA